MFQQLLPPRHVHGLEWDCYFTYSQHICAKSDYKNIFTVMVKGLNIHLIPYEFALQYLIQFFQRNG
jgi:hypothetical protein